MEAAARHFRYRALIKEALRQGAGAIVTAHTADDNLELCLMRILRGSGPEGLGRMPLSRSITVGKNGGSLFILRPLLGLYRKDVEFYLKALGFSWRSDATNSDERFLRNRVRAKLVPLLDKEFSGWRRGLEALGDTQGLAAGFIREEARRLVWEWQAGGKKELRSGGNGFFDLPLIIREEALFRGLNIFQDSHPGAVVKRRNLRRFAGGEIQDLDLGFCRIRALRTEGRVSIFRRDGGEAGFSLLIKGPGLYKLEGIAGLRANSGAALRVWKKGENTSARRPGEDRGFFAALPLVLRPFHSGDGAAAGGPDRFRFTDLKPHGRKEISGMLTRSVPAPCFQDIVVAQDAAGPAAFIGLSSSGAVTLWNRETRDPGDFFFCGIGGIDA
jgi:tRNA(Ile)-lysidine synthase